LLLQRFYFASLYLLEGKAINHVKNYYTKRFALNERYVWA